MICIHLSGLNTITPYGCSNLVAFRFGAAGQHNIGKNLILCNFMRNNGTNASGTDN